MKNALFVLAFIFGVAYNVLAFKCPNTPTYNQKIITETLCRRNEVNILSPNYENVGQYFRCEGEGNPILEQCPSYSVFDYTQQKCTRCARYIPSSECKDITNTKNCEKFTSVEKDPEEEAQESCEIDYPKYNKSFIPTCVGNDIYMNWPKYNNSNQYYVCNGAYNPQIKSCEKGKYFNYYKQSCVGCSSYVAPPLCDKLPFDKSNKCEPIGSLKDPQPLITENEDNTCLDLMKGFNETLKPSCKNAEILWPNYENFRLYYICFGINNPQSASCPSNSYFSFPLQKCVRCKNFIPPPDCKKLPSSAGVCVRFKPEDPSTPSIEECDYTSAAYYNTVYKTKLELSCVGNQIYKLWPDYGNATQYIVCKGAYNPQIIQCPENTFFNYYQQECTPCQKFLPPPECEKLQPLDTSRKCIKK